MSWLTDAEAAGFVRRGETFSLDGTYEPEHAETCAGWRERPPDFPHPWPARVIYKPACDCGVLRRGVHRS